MKTLNTNIRLITIIALLAASALWGAPVSSRIKHPGQDGERRYRGADTPISDSRVPSSNGARIDDIEDIEASRRSVEVTDVGPERGYVLGLDGFLIDPDNPREILASTKLGVFKSADGGRNWRSASAGITVFGHRARATNIRRDPSHPRTVYALATPGGLYRSLDFGEHWSRLTTDVAANDLAVSPTDPSVLFLVSQDVFYKSTDGGATVVPQTGTGLPETNLNLGIFPSFTNIVITPSDPQTMYVVDNRHGIYKSSDGGASFIRLSASPFSSGQVFPHPTQPETIFVEAFSGTTGLFRSFDGGASFTEVAGGLPAGTVQFITFDPKDPSTLYASSTQGLLRSTDEGFTFRSLGITPEQLDVARGGAATLSIDPRNPRVLYASTGRGNFKSMDHGRSFTEINDGFRATEVSNVVFDNDDDPSLYVIADGVLFRTHDRGKHYEEITLPQDAFPMAVAVAPTNRNRIVVTSDAGIFISADRGRSWSASPAGSGDIDFSGSHIAIDPRDARNVYVAADAFFLRSTDGGQTFTTTPMGNLVLALAIDPEHPNTLYISTVGGVLKSSDGGLTFASTFSNSVSQIVIDPQDSQTVYVGGVIALNPFPADLDAVLRSVDGGVTFTPADNGISIPSLALAIDPLQPARLFAICPAKFLEPTGLFESNDGGTSWKQLDPGGETSLRDLDELAINPNKPKLIYLGGMSLLEVELKH